MSADTVAALRRDDALVSQVIWARLRALVNEAGATLRRTAFSFPTRESNDFATVLLDLNGDSIAQSAQSIPSFLATMPLTTKAILKWRPLEQWGPGDAVLTNDPWIGAGHLPDVSIVQPIFWRDRLVGFMGSITHVADVGGMVFGGQSKELFEEGLRFPPTLIQTVDGPNPTFFDIIRANTRVPDEVIGDFQALMAANDTGARGVGLLLSEGELRDLTEFGHLVQDRSEAAMRDAIRQVPNGVYYGQVQADGYDEPIIIKCAVHVMDDEVLIDYEGSSPQVPYPLNGVHNFTFAYTVYPVKCAIAGDIPNNQGSLRPFTVNAPLGSVLNCRFPAPVGLRHINGQLLQAAVFGALWNVIPERVIADSGTPSTISVITGRTSEEESFVSYLYLAGGMGARATKDGINTANFPATVTTVPVEVTEQAAPLLFERKEYRPGSAGRGRQRGGYGQEVRIRNISPWPIMVSMLADRQKQGPGGLAGAPRSEPGRVFLESGLPMKAKGHTSVQPGDCFVMQTPGGAGYGVPAERPPELITQDRAEGLETE
jgi:N-methylhydantoinase B